MITPNTGKERSFLVLALFLVNISQALALVATTGTGTGTGTPARMEIWPVTVTLQQVSHAYDISLARRLFSSEPRREYALQNISCSFCRKLVMLTGDSSSGKSTLLRLIAGSSSNTATSNPGVSGKATTAGSIYIGCHHPDSSISTTTSDPFCRPPTPIYLDQRPVFSTSNRHTVYQLLHDEILKKENVHSPIVPHQYLVNVLMETLTKVFEAQTWMDKFPNQLSTSEIYKLRLMVASVEGMLGKNKQQKYDDDDKRNLLDYDDDDAVVLPAPILLLDEWMDKETSSVIQSVQDGLVRLVDMTGAVVISITHKPERWRLTATTTATNGALLTAQMTLRQGKLITPTGPSSSRD
jgi:energy-coupling factor transporter ATP-binding protein EcfA2